jgi:hypothetical protein
MKQCRKLLEEDLGVPDKALDCEKAFIKDLVDKVEASAAPTTGCLRRCLCLV